MSSTDDRRAPAVSVVVPARNAEATLRRTLEALEAQTVEAGYEVIVVDNGSTDSTAEIAESFAPLTSVIANPLPGGPGSARNVGVAAARGKVIAFTDADCFPAADWLASGLRALADADFVQGAVEPDPRTRRTPFDRTLVLRGDGGYYPTANVLIRRELFDAQGGFEDWIVDTGGDPPFGWRAPKDGRRVPPVSPPIGEDTLFAWRARRAGARIAFAGDALVHHAVFPGSIGERVRRDWRWKRHMPALAKRIPELRDERFFLRYFVDRRSAGFDLAVLACLLAAASGRRTPLIGALPYARWIWHEASDWGPRTAPSIAIGAIADDAASLAALIVGSAAWRAPLF